MGEIEGVIILSELLKEEGCQDEGFDKEMKRYGEHLNQVKKKGGVKSEWKSS
ncbi:hypothetical protein LHV56_19270 [Peribacillus frigoritolerans]|uniref:hypothetical protein n=1 Tax=Peribacillus frigoritolerans TaxID=450367 RepID=UPI00207A66A7|nr:hypothetical protein [Peribacillus frigoritolerans]USK78972.1 hypothetical protein LHV56_19270 [Peribacillus frigoritolerans]